MRRILIVILAAIGMIALGGVAASAAQASYSASLTQTSTPCEFSLATAWKNAKVDHVYGTWSLDGTAFDNFLFTTEAPGTGPNAGVFKAHSASFTVGPLAVAAETHTIYARAQFYYKGAFQYEILSQLDATCTRFA
jgi:hypothetical protein